LADNQRITKEVIAQAKLAGIRENEIVVSYSRVVPPTRALGQTNYEAVNTIDMTLKSLGTFDSLITSLYGAGATSISNILFTTEGSEELEKEAIGKAVEDAQARAKEIGQSLGKRVSRMVSITTVELGEAGALSGESQGSLGGSPSQIEIVRGASILFELR
jgi:uncharacterized protein YggE